MRPARFSGAEAAFIPRPPGNQSRRFPRRKRRVPLRYGGFQAAIDTARARGRRLGIEHVLKYGT
jgi:hypothetical protein